jgi:hypothetical protein
LDVAVIKELLEKKFGRVELPKRFLPVSIRGEVGKGITSVPWSDVSDETSEAGSSIVKGEENGIVEA